eukprot:5963536-Pleurochrysis_carterae.AAC.6
MRCNSQGAMRNVDCTLNDQHAQAVTCVCVGVGAGRQGLRRRRGRGAGAGCLAPRMPTPLCRRGARRPSHRCPSAPTQPSQTEEKDSRACHSTPHESNAQWWSCGVVRSPASSATPPIALAPCAAMAASPAEWARVSRPMSTRPPDVSPSPSLLETDSNVALSVASGALATAVACCSQAWSQDRAMLFERPSARSKCATALKAHSYK